MTSFHPSRRRHVAGRVRGPRQVLDDDCLIARHLRTALFNEGATIVGEVRYPFRPQGVTVVFLLAESHASVHTWPEEGVGEVDVFTCGETVDPRKVFDRLVFGLVLEVLSVVEVRTDEEVWKETTSEMSVAEWKEGPTR